MINLEEEHYVYTHNIWNLVQQLNTSIIDLVFLEISINFFLTTLKGQISDSCGKKIVLVVFLHRGHRIMTIKIFICSIGRQ
jgi:hypothetical protein